MKARPTVLLGALGLMTGLIDQIGASVRQSGKAEVRVGRSEILMVQGIEHLPAQFKVLLLRQMELLGKRRVQVVKSGGPEIGQPRASGSELPRPRVVGTVIGPEGLIPSKSGLEARWVNPLRDLLLT